MVTEDEGTEPASGTESKAATGPDFLLVTADRMPDHGPRYTETPANPYAPDAPFIAEPWNTVTASFFIWRLQRAAAPGGHERATQRVRPVRH